MSNDYILHHLRLHAKLQKIQYFKANYVQYLGKHCKIVYSLGPCLFSGPVNKRKTFLLMWLLLSLRRSSIHPVWLLSDILNFLLQPYTKRVFYATCFRLNFVRRTGIKTIPILSHNPSCESQCRFPLWLII